MQATPSTKDPSDAGIVVPLSLQAGEDVLSFISTISTFGTAVDITLSELAVEAFYPANARTAEHMLREVVG